MDNSGGPYPTATPVTDERRMELWRDATVMALYMSIVLLAEMVALPEDYSVTPSSTGHPPIWLIIWGTTIGLAMAHWFAYNLAAVEFRGRRTFRHDLESATSQVAAAAVVAVSATIPAILANDTIRVDAAAFGPALIVGVAGFLAAREAGRSLTASVVAGGAVLALGLLVATIKAILAGH